MPPLLPRLFATLTHGVYVIGVGDGERHNAFTAAWVMQVSFDPPLLALSINPDHASYRLLRQSRAFSVNVLGREHLELAGHFGLSSRVDKLAGVSWTKTNLDMPRLNEALAWFDCRLHGEMVAGDHVLVTGLVLDGGIGDAGEPLTYRDTGALDGSAALYPSGFPRE